MEAKKEIVDLFHIPKKFKGIAAMDRIHNIKSSCSKILVTKKKKKLLQKITKKYLPLTSASFEDLCV